MTRCQFTAVDCASRGGVVGVRARATAGTAADFLADLLDRFPVPVKAIQIDGGSEWMQVFEAACQERGLPLWVLLPHCPKRNGQVERLNRTGREEFWECYEGALDLPIVGKALRAWEAEYNTVRAHHALVLRTPAQFLADHLSKSF